MMSNCMNLQSLLFGMFLNQRMTSSVFFHWLKFSSFSNLALLVQIYLTTPN